MGAAFAAQVGKGGLACVASRARVTLQPGRAVDAMQVARMVRALVHRGPDGDGLFVDPSDRAALGMRRLAIIDLVSGEHTRTDDGRRDGSGTSADAGLRS